LLSSLPPPPTDITISVVTIVIVVIVVTETDIDVDVGVIDAIAFTAAITAIAVTDGGVACLFTRQTYTFYYDFF
jgi:hypothetical protein